MAEEVNHDDAANYRMSSPIKRRFSLNEDGEVRKVALLTGVTGQDGSYLAELLLDKVSGVVSKGNRGISYDDASGVWYSYRERGGVLGIVVVGGRNGCRTFFFRLDCRGWEWVGGFRGRWMSGCRSGRVVMGIHSNSDTT